jgi:hypothetical protein
MAGKKRLLTLLRRRGGGITWPGLGSSLAALYLFDDGAGTTLTDTSGNGLNGTLGATTAAPSWVTEGLSFDGGDYVTLPGGGALDLSGNNATIAWVVTNFPKTATTNELRERTIGADGRTTSVMFAPATLATFRTVLDSLIATID